jgi:hypothetical protein
MCTITLYLAPNLPLATLQINLKVTSYILPIATVFKLMAEYLGCYCLDNQSMLPVHRE